MAAESTGAASGAFVMVPVPEDLVEEVGKHLLWLRWQSQGAVVPWSVDDLVALLEAADEEMSRVVRATATAALANRSLLDVDLAEQLGISTRELGGLVRELNDAAAPGVLDLVVLHRSQRGGEVVREVQMTPGHAQSVLEAETVVRRRRRR